MLIENGANIDAIDNNGDTPLSVASWSGSEHVVGLLLERGANVNDKNNDGATPLHQAVAQGEFISV